MKMRSGFNWLGMVSSFGISVVESSGYIVRESAGFSYHSWFFTQSVGLSDI
jgi:hypothetical protein